MGRRGPATTNMACQFSNVVEVFSLHGGNILLTFLSRSVKIRDKVRRKQARENRVA